MAGLAALALLGIAPDPDVDAPAANPAILDVTFAPDHLRAGAEFAVTIHTTPDITALEALGVAKVYTPGTTTQSIIDFIESAVRARD